MAEQGSATNEACEKVAVPASLLGKCTTEAALYWLVLRRMSIMSAFLGEMLELEHESLQLTRQVSGRDVE